MGRLLARLGASQHLLLAVLSAWLIITSPWVHLLRRIPRSAGLLDYAHVVFGLLTLVSAVGFTAYCVRGSGWRLYFPWLSGDLRQVGRELRGLARGEVPTAEGGGIFALIEGLLLLAVLMSGFTGVAWLLSQGSAEALDWRHYHILAARGMIIFFALHVLTVSLHLLDFIRE